MCNKQIEERYKIKIGYSYNPDNPCFYIKDSYKITNKKQIKEILEQIHTTRKYSQLQTLGYTRSLSSEYREWAAHNVLYRLNIKRDHTATTDFEQKEAWWKRVVYAILSIF